MTVPAQEFSLFAVPFFGAAIDLCSSVVLYVEGQAALPALQVVCFSGPLCQFGPMLRSERADGINIELIMSIYSLSKSLENPKATVASRNRMDWPVDLQYPGKRAAPLHLVIT